MQTITDFEEPLSDAERKVLETLQQHVDAVLDLIHRQRDDDDVTL